MSSRLRVLIVEDELLIADFIAFAVEDAGHDVVGMCETADDALRLMTQTRPDVAILDIKINGRMDGVELAGAMQAAGLAVLHIFISGSGDPETRARAEATGPTGFLQKPFNNEQLEAMLKVALSRS